VTIFHDGSLNDRDPIVTILRIKDKMMEDALADNSESLHGLPVPVPASAARLQ